jgi:hypothetical protein
VIAPPVPVTVNEYVPFATERAAVTVSVVEEPPAGFGEKVPVTPDGRPVTDIFSVEAKPPVRVIATV